MVLQELREDVQDAATRRDRVRVCEWPPAAISAGLDCLSSVAGWLDAALLHGKRVSLAQ
jgi:hypothetical protein